MNLSTTITTAPAGERFGGAFWERLWRLSGVTFLLCLVIAFALYGNPPHVGASADALVSYYDAHRARILVAAAVSGMAILNLLWFAAAIRAALADAGRDGWGAAVTASSAFLGGSLLLPTAIGAALAYAIAGSGSLPLITGLNDFAWASLVMTSFPRAMLIMAGSFGLWRSGLISNALFAAGVAAIVLTLLGGTTWLSSGIWAPDGVYTRIISPVIGIAWVVVVSRVLLTRVPAARTGW